MFLYNSALKEVTTKLEILNDDINGYLNTYNRIPILFKSRNILEKVEGVGDVDVFISYKNKDDGLKHSTIFSKENDDNNYSSSEIISYIIVARGGGKAEIVSMIRNSISEALDIPLHKVIVLKMDE